MKRLLFLLLSILLLAPLAYAGGYEDFSAFNLDWSGGNNSRLAFYTPLTSTASILSPPRAYPGTAATFSRASAQYFTDFEGVVRKVESGSVAVEGSRVVTNLLTYSEDLSNAAWVKDGTCTVTGTNIVNLPANNDAIRQTIAGQVYGSKFVATGVLSGTGTIQLYVYVGNVPTKRIVTLSSSPTRYSTIVETNISATTVNAYFYIKRDATTATSVTIHSAQLENVTGQTNQNPGEYVKTTSTAVSKCYSTTNGNTVNGTTGVVTEATGTALPQSYSERQNSTAYVLNDKIQVSGWWYYCTTAGTSDSSAPTFPQGKAGSQTVTDGTAVWTIGGRLLLGYVSEPASTNKVTAYGIIPADTLGSELSSGSLTIGQKYQITARTDANFVADGAADNVVGTQFVATAATVTLDAGDKVKRVQWGVGEKSFHNGSAFVQNITGLTLSGDTAAVLSIVTDETEITRAGLANINPTYKVYKLDNSAGSAVANTDVASGVGVGNTNPHSYFILSRVAAGTATLKLALTSSGTSGVSFANTAYAKVKKENAVPGSIYDTPRVVAAVGQTLYFLLPQLEELSYATSIMPPSGATVTRAATSLSYPTAGNLSSPLWSAKITATPATASQDGKLFLGSYLDANNSVGLLMSGANAVARKRIGGSNYDATKPLTLVAGTTKRFGMRGSSSGWSLFVDGVLGTDSADTTTPVAGATLQLGLDGNSGNAFYGYLRDFYLYNKPLADGRFQ
jgi:mannose/fructose/N-acetylgalactosamine-specific phosphotransferase system component IIB